MTVIDEQGNDVDATIINEVEIKNDSGPLVVDIGNGVDDPVAVETGASIRIPYAAHNYEFGRRDHHAAGEVVVPAEEMFVIETIAAEFLEHSGSGAVYTARIDITTGGWSRSLPLWLLRLQRLPAMSGTS